MNHMFNEFCEKADKAKEKGKGLKFLRYGKNLRYNSGGIYCCNTKIANFDFNNRTTERIGYCALRSANNTATLR